MKHAVKGFALPTLMALLALASMATLLALRNVWVHDQLLNAHADQLRTQHKAEAVLPIALADLLGKNNNTTTTDLRHTPGDAQQTHAFFPNSMAEYTLLRQRLIANNNACSVGICAPSALNPTNTTSTTGNTKASYWKTQIATAASVSAADTPYGEGTAWYWIEVFPQTDTDTLAYRITTLAKGVMPGSTTVLQGLWAKRTSNAPSGQWHSWHVLHD